MLKNSVFVIFFALFLSACSFETKALIQTNNEGIFIQAKKNQSINLHIHNPSKIPNDLENKLIAKFKDLNFNLKDKNADYDIFINIVDFKNILMLKDCVLLVLNSFLMILIELMMCLKWK